MNRVAAFTLALSALLALPRAGWAQSILNGSAEIDAINSSNQTADQDSSNGSFNQNYSLGWTSALWDPRIVRYNLSGNVRTGTQSLTATGRPDLSGRANDFGYAMGATLLQSSVMPFFFQVSRTRDTSAGDFAPVNALRGGVVSATGVPAADYQSLNHDLSLGWHLSANRLPQVEIGYRKSSADTTGGAYEATQDLSDFSGTISTASSATHQTLRYQATSTENVLQTTFTQRLGNLDYDFGRTLTRHTRATARAGHRTMFYQSAFQVPVDPNSGAYAPVVTNGNLTSDYGQAGYAWDPNGRFSIHADGGAERQGGDTASTSALLGSLSGHATVVTGLDLFASGTGGHRQQVVDGVPLTVATETAEAGASYQVSTRWFGAGAKAQRGTGRNATLDGRTGSTTSWSGDAHVSANYRLFTANGGYSRAINYDGILDFGNYEQEQVRGSLQAQAKRGSVSFDATNLHISRGRDATFARNVQTSLSTTASFRLVGQSFVAATAGRFVNDQQAAAIGPGIDRNTFWNISFDGSLSRNLRLSTWLRSEVAYASRTQFSQDGLSGFARLDYRLRTLLFQLEYRKSRNLTQFPGVLNIGAYTGRQVRFSVIRQFGFRAR